MKSVGKMDSKLRKLERRALATQAPDDIIAYWNACIRAGELPTPSAEDDMGFVWFLEEAPGKVELHTDSDGGSWLAGAPLVSVTNWRSHITEVGYTRTSNYADPNRYTSVSFSEGDPKITPSILKMLSLMIADYER